MIDWSTVDNVLLDMDGTLLDLHFDTQFWLEMVPERYALKHELSLEQAKAALYPRLEAVRGQLQWYCLDYWQRELELDIVAMKRELAHLIGFRPGAEDFLAALKASNKRVILITNAHQDSLSLKLERINLAQYFDEIISSHEYGYPKECSPFWERLQAQTGISAERSVFIDDSLDVLRSAKRWGIDKVFAIDQPNLQSPAMDTAEFEALSDFSEILPIA